MGYVILAGDPPIEIALRRSARSRRLSLRVSHLDGRVTMSLPKWTSNGEALEFARQKETWVRKNLAARPEMVLPQIGGLIAFRGDQIPIIAGGGRGARLIDGQLFVPNDPSKTASRVAAFLKVTARQYLAEASDRHAATLGCKYGRMTLRDTRSRWGSCTAEGDLMYSWRLIMAPPEVLDYVAAHEVAHLVEMNHSAAFWATVDRIFPNHAPVRKWLRLNGQLLHAVKFVD